jgi:hypothetical protein
MNYYDTRYQKWPDIGAFLISGTGILPDIRQVKSCIRPDIEKFGLSGRIFGGPDIPCIPNIQLLDLDFIYNFKA